MTTINLQPFTMPAVTKLLVQNLGEPFPKQVSEGVLLPFRRIRYEMHDANGTIRELGETEIPESIYALCGQFVMGDVSEQTLATLNAFF